MSHTRVTFAPKTRNAKLNSLRKPDTKVATTYASTVSSCPSSCALRGKGCYAEVGPVGFTVNRLNRAAKRSAPVATAREEAAAIDASFKGSGVPQDGAGGGRDLRLHTSGDASTPTAAALLGAAAQRWRERDGGDVWTYTHAHATVHRSFWTEAVSVLASIDTLDQVPAAQAQGYALARYVPSFPSFKAWREGGVKWVPCPAQLSDPKINPDGWGAAPSVGCADCRLCMDSEGLKARNTGVAFAVHGARQNTIKRRLAVVQA